MKKSKHTVVKLTAAAIVVITAIALLGMWITTKNIEAVANQFKPDSTWRLESEKVVPAQPCIAGSGPCPLVSRSWRTRAFIGSVSLQKIIDNSGWHSVKIEDTACDTGTLDGDGNHVAICSAYGRVDGYDVTVSSFSYENTRKVPIVSLYIK